jgi:tetratricopeptide (TPR) repeat protein
VLLLAVVAAYHPAWHGTLLWDDDGHLTRAELRSWTGLWRIWFELGATQQYYPLVHSAFWLQSRLWGDAFFGYHLVNMLLHGLSAFLLGAVLRRLSVPGAALAAVIFALHPVQVESVAWMTELKNTLSGVFYLSAALAYLRFVAERTARHYWLALALFACALLSKTVTATLPAALLVVLWWKRGALDWRRDVGPLLPFFALGAVGGLTTAWVERTFIGAFGADFALTPIERVLVAGRALFFYAGKVVWPANLIFIYPRWSVSQTAWWQYLYPLAAAGTLAALWTWRRRSRAPLAAALFFAVTLGPALGFFNVYPFRYSYVADHFQYLACIGIIVLASAAIVTVVRALGPSRPRSAELLVTVAVGILLASLTTMQAGQYVDAETLYARTLDRNPRCWLCHENLGVLALARTPPARQEAIARFREALEINPNDPQVHNNLGTTLMELGRLDEAVAEHRLAIRFAPGYAEAYGNLGAALQKLGRLEEAADAYRNALDIKPGLAVSRMNLAVVLQQLNKPEEASAELRQAAKTHESTPATASAASYAQLGEAAAATGRVDEAIAHFREALRVGPPSSTIRVRFAIVLWHAGRLQEAESELRQALQAGPDASAYAMLGNVLHAAGRLDAAIEAYEASLRIQPAAADAHNDLGVALARAGRRDEAVRHFQEAVRLQPDFAAARANLAKAQGR